MEAARFVKEQYGRLPAIEFGPLSLQVVQAKMIEAGLSRGVINNHTGRIKRIFKWGVAQELIPPTSLQAMQAVGGLRKGRSEARETDPVLPVDDATVDTTVSKLPEVVADMVRFQRRPDKRLERCSAMAVVRRIRATPQAMGRRD